MSKIYIEHGVPAYLSGESLVAPSEKYPEYIWEDIPSEKMLYMLWSEAASTVID